MNYQEVYRTKIIYCKTCDAETKHYQIDLDFSFRLVWECQECGSINNAS